MCCHKIKMADDKCQLELVKKASVKSCDVFGITELYPEQQKAIAAFVLGKDVFLNLPTGYGKSAVFQMVPLVHAEMAAMGKTEFSLEPIVIVISPLISLMDDQRNFLNGIGVKAGCIGNDEADSGAIERGKYRIVYTSPESLLGNRRWRAMLTSETYQRNLIGIAVDEAHVINHW